MIVWNWFNANAGGVQAVATVVLVCITIWYVKLTAGLAAAANAESLRQNEAAKARRRELMSQVRVLHGQLDSLPNLHKFYVDKMFRKSVDWKNFDFDIFRKLASEISDSTASHAATIELEMRKMEEMMDLLSSKYSAGFKWSDFPQSEWMDSMSAALRDVISIIFELSSEP